MTSKADKLLEQMRRSKANWKRVDLDRLYEGFGFIITHGANHDKLKHPDFPEVRELRATLPRHRTLDKVYIEEAIKRIDRLLELKKGK
jgi:hypothetical protein